MVKRRTPGRIVVTGGAGFIGAHTVRELIAHRSAVLVIDDLRHASDVALDPAADLAAVDVASEAAHRAINAFKPDALLHLAAEGGVGRSWRDPVGSARANVIGTINMLDAAHASGCRRVVLASSGGALYGAAERLPTPETEVPAPMSPYGTSKYTAELYLETYRRVHHLSALAVRYGNVYGPGQDGSGEAGLIAITCRRLLAGQVAQIRGDGRQTRDFVYVTDVAEANLLALEAELEGAVNIGTGRESTVEQVVADLARLSGTAAPSERMALPEGEVRRSVLATGRATAELPWTASTTLTDGLARTWSAFSAATHAPATPSERLMPAAASSAAPEGSD